MPRLYLDREVGRRARQIGAGEAPPQVQYATPKVGFPKDERIVTKDWTRARQRFTNWGLLPTDTRKLKETVNKAGLSALTPN